VSSLGECSSFSRCPGDAVIDQIEGDTMRVLGASGVRSIATSAVSSTEPIREGMRVRRARDGQCVLERAERALALRVRSRLRALQRRGERLVSDTIESRTDEHGWHSTMWGMTLDRTPSGWFLPGP
jgi:hypothetical protein